MEGTICVYRPYLVLAALSLVFLVFFDAVAHAERIAHSRHNSTHFFHPNTPDNETRVYFMKRTSGPGCPYTASWLAHVNLYRRIKYWIDITKMEAATFTIYDKTKYKFQLSDPNAYFVHHMSMYEHLNHKAYGFQVAQNKSIILASSAMRGECASLQAEPSGQYLALIPFYGGLPPNVTQDLSVKSIGQGNSLVDSNTKAMQTLATLCSCLRYFGHAVVGVVRDEDRELMLSMIQQLDSKLRHHVNVVQFRVGKPSFLPFHLLAWGQHFVKHHNCRHLYQSVPTNGATPLAKNAAYYGFHEGEVDIQRASNESEYEICFPRAITPYTGGPVQVIYMRRTASFIEKLHANRTRQEATNHTSPLPIKYVYYTESDQIVRFDDWQTFRALSAASNESSLFAGRRKEKIKDSDPADYMGQLNMWKECGAAGYSLTWPKSPFVYQDA